MEDQDLQTSSRAKRLRDQDDDQEEAPLAKKTLVSDNETVVVPMPPIFVAEPGDKYVPIEKILIPSATGRYECLRDFLEHGSIEHCRIVRLRSVFGMFFAIGIECQDGKKKTTQQRMAKFVETLENAAQLRKSVEKLKSDCCKLECISNLCMDWIIPMVGCPPLDSYWRQTKLPFDVALINPNAVLKDNNMLLEIVPSGIEDDSIAGADIVHHLYNVELFIDHGVPHMRVLLNYSLLYRLLKNVPFNKIPCSKFLALCSAKFPSQIVTPYLDVLKGKYLGDSIRPDNLSVDDLKKNGRYLELLSPELLPDCQLLPYQRDAVAWMLCVEHRKVSPMGSCTSVTNTLAGPIYCDNHTGQWVCDPSDSSVHPVHYRGGILADEMGLGKTLQMLALVASNPSTLIPNLESVFDQTSIPSRATLVIAPNHLIESVWAVEAARLKLPKVIVLTTKRNFEKVTVQEIMHADIVLTSVDFLTGKVHLHTEENQMDPAESPSQYKKSLEKSFALMSSKKLLQLTMAPLFMFFWHRVILDEAHQLLGKLWSGRLNPLLSIIAATKVWLVSGTPFADKMVAENMCKVLQIEYEHNGEPCLTALPQYLVWRNTKRSVADQIDIPPMEEHIHFLDFTPTERALYNAAVRNDDLQRQKRLCCQPVLPGDREVEGAGRSLEEIEQILIGNREMRIQVLVRDIEGLVKRLEQKEMTLNRRLTSTEEAMTETQVANKLQKIENIKALIDIRTRDLQTLKREVEYFTAAVKIRDSVSYNAELDKTTAVGPCPICLDMVISPTLTMCGHLFCHKCIKTCLEKSEKCPVCRAETDERDILPITCEKPSQDPQQLQTISWYTVKYGTKMGNLVHHLLSLWLEDPQARVVIFGSRNVDLSTLADVLTRENIKSAFCQGNVAVRNKALRRFTDLESDMRVMMLSLENTAAGSNLLAASEIILLDSLWDDKNIAQRVSNELQAINRAHRIGQTKKVCVVRMLIRDTVEFDRFMSDNVNNTQAVDVSQNHIVRNIVY